MLGGRRHRRFTGTSGSDEYSMQFRLWLLRTAVLTCAGRCNLRVEFDRLDPGFWAAVGLRSEPKDAREAREKMRRSLNRLERSEINRDGPVFQNVERLGRLIGLTEPECEVLVIAVMCRQIEWFDLLLANPPARTVRGLAEVLSAILGMPHADVAQALSQERALMQTGLIRLNLPSKNYHCELNDILSIEDEVADTLLREHINDDSFLSCFFGRSPAAGLSLKDFPHLAKELDLIGSVLGSALRKQRQGINVLLYGPPGTGKTELARALASTLEVPLY